MSPLLPVAFLTAIGIVAGPILFIYKRVKRTSLQSILILCLLSLSFPIFLMVLYGLDRATTEYKFNVAPESIPHIQLPPTARDVNYRYAPGRGLHLAVEFGIAEPDFLRWMESQGWKAEPITQEASVVPVKEFADSTFVAIIVQQGYRFDDYDTTQFDDSGTTVIYCRESEKVFVQSTSY